MYAPRLRAPIVLVHGLLGTDTLRLGPVRLFDYFRGIPEVLRAGGNRVVVVRVGRTDGVAVRAAQLARQLPNEPVHLIGHSMGGLDSRYLISRLGLASR